VNYGEMFSRNLGIISREEQDRIASARILLAGIGAEGGATATCLARLGFQRFRLADVDDFDVSNLNRQFGAYTDTVGLPKVQGLAQELRRINPLIQIEEVPEGVTPENAKRLMEDVQCVVNGVDLFALEAAQALDQAAREAKLTIVGGASVGFRSDVYAYHPEGIGIAEYIEKTFAAGRFPWIPADADLPPSASAVLVREVIERQIPAPVVAPAVFLTGARVATLILGLLTGRGAPVYVPQYTTMDLVEMSTAIRPCFPDEVGSATRAPGDVGAMSSLSEAISAAD
jgi:molybdopterin/thiamine biosynthesis adenylyltransferase